MRGLRETVLLAIKLNRTLVGPIFFVDRWTDHAVLSGERCILY